MKPASSRFKVLQEMHSRRVPSKHRLITGLCLVVALQAIARPATEDLVTPKMTDAEPAAGMRVRQVAPEYKGTDVYHALYLPTNWKPGGEFSVIVEYTGNQWAKGGSSGEVKDANLAYGLTGGKDFIWVSMPYIEEGGQENAVWWWGDRQATINYCKANVPRICRQFGGNPDSVFICGFSRGPLLQAISVWPMMRLRHYGRGSSHTTTLTGIRNGATPRAVAKQRSVVFHA